MFEINDAQILMYLDGVADSEVKAIIENERTYQERAQELQNQQKHWVSQMYRADCPEPFTLGEYYLDKIPGALHKKIREHISKCPHCIREFEELKTFLQVSFVERLIARLVSGGENAHWGESLAYGLRGGEENLYVYETGDVQIAIDVQDDNLHPSRKAVIGLINGAPAEDFEVTIWMEGSQTGTAHVDELNYFKIDNLVRGEYEILIRGPKIEILVQKFMIT